MEELKRASLEDLSKLQRVCMEGYSSYFFDYWNENGLKWYLDKQFGDEKLKSDLNDKNIDYYFINSNDKPIGFIKINNDPTPDAPFEQSTELEKMYVLPAYKGMGIGKKVLSEVIKMIKGREKKTLFLYVLDTNEKAIAFYDKLGFKFRNKIRLSFPYFKDELRGLNLMFKELK